jgi:hypothetical protein
MVISIYLSCATGTTVWQRLGWCHESLVKQIKLCAFNEV